MPLKPHPTDPEKMVYVKSKYRTPEETWDEPRTWVGLTDEEINSWDLPVLPTLTEFARFLEAKIKEKNS